MYQPLLLLTNWTSSEFFFRTLGPTKLSRRQYKSDRFDWIDISESSPVSLWSILNDGIQGRSKCWSDLTFVKLTATIVVKIVLCSGFGDSRARKLDYAINDQFFNRLFGYKREYLVFFENHFEIFRRLKDFFPLKSLNFLLSSILGNTIVILTSFITSLEYWNKNSKIRTKCNHFSLAEIHRLQNNTTTRNFRLNHSKTSTFINLKWWSDQYSISLLSSISPLLCISISYPKLKAQWAISI